MFHAVNDVVIRTPGTMMGINVELDGVGLPTYWADGLLVSTSVGSTAYSLSAGGPIVVPSSDVLIVSPICPHNLNVRPLVVPKTSCVRISCSSRNKYIFLSADNITVPINPLSIVDISPASYSLQRLRCPNSSFIGALTSKLHWGEDSRNER